MRPKSFKISPIFLENNFKVLKLFDILTSLFLISVLARLVWVDTKTLRLPDIYTLPLIFAGLVLSQFEGGIGTWSSLLGGGVGFAVFWAIGAYYFKRTGTEGLGLGDAKLFAASGTWLGISALPFVLLIAALSGLIFAFMRKSKPGDALAFGPWLAFAFGTIWMADRIGLGWLFQI